MKKILIMVLIISQSLFLSNVCSANLSINPLEISISMVDEFFKGNTSKKIIVTNEYDNFFNVTWYIENPNPKSWIRPNRTFIPNLSWIQVEPKWLQIPPDENGMFYIYLNIPDDIELINLNWEVWVTFKKGEQKDIDGIFDNEYAIRVYIDTPKNLVTKYNQSDCTTNYGELYYIIFASIVIILLFTTGVLIKRKKIKK